MQASTGSGREIYRQNLEVWTLYGKSQYRSRENQEKATGRQQTDAHLRRDGDDSGAWIIEATGAKHISVIEPSQRLGSGSVHGSF